MIKPVRVTVEFDDGSERSWEGDIRSVEVKRGPLSFDELSSEDQRLALAWQGGGTE